MPLNTCSTNWPRLSIEYRCNFTFIVQFIDFIGEVVLIFGSQQTFFLLRRAVPSEQHLCGTLLAINSMVRLKNSITFHILTSNFHCYTTQRNSTITLFISLLSKFTIFYRVVITLYFFNIKIVLYFAETLKTHFCLRCAYATFNLRRRTIRTASPPARISRHKLF